MENRFGILKKTLEDFAKEIKYASNEREEFAVDREAYKFIHKICRTSKERIKYKEMYEGMK